MENRDTITALKEKPESIFADTRGYKKIAVEGSQKPARFSYHPAPYELCLPSTKRSKSSDMNADENNSRTNVSPKPGGHWCWVYSKAQRITCCILVQPPKSMVRGDIFLCKVVI